MKAKNLTFQGKIPYFQKAVPKDLQGIIGKKKIIERLVCDNTDQHSIEAALLKVRKSTQELFDMYRGNNRASDVTDDKTEQVRAAEQLLKLKGLKRGELDRDNHDLDLKLPEEKEAFEQYFDHVIDTHFGDLVEREQKRRHRREVLGVFDDLSNADKVEYLALKMLKETKFGQVERHTINEAVADYIDSNGLNKPSPKHHLEKSRRRQMSRLKAVLSSCDGNATISTTNIRTAINGYLDKREGKVTVNTLKRDITGFKTALSTYIDRCNLDAVVTHRKLRKAETKPRRVPTKDEYQQIYKAVIDLENKMAPELRLMLLLMIQTSVHIQELLDIEIPTDKALKDCLILPKGKTKSRTRPVVFTLSSDLILKLVAEIGAKSSDTSNRVFKSDNTWIAAGSTYVSKKVIRAIRDITGSDNLESYSFRHGWKSHAILATAPSDIQNRLGGWTDNSNLGALYGRGADLSAERIEVYRIWQDRINAKWLRG